ncbi:FecCD family ABC transporter permease [Alteribacillus sp. HJP-4]|uniref:FecCD family ABC transporter permease n=1 Tax=Alteribacillus sp. HJP-4 TaxID=2775394 RepID=UPI0035CCE0C2
MVESAKAGSENKQTQKLRRKPAGAALILSLGMVLLLIMLFFSISFGAADVDLKMVWQAVFHYDSSITNHQIIQEVRLPRALASVMIGAFLAVSGAIMQGMTRNPLASPSIMGVTDGAAFAMAVALAFFPSTSYLGFMFWAFAGAGLGAGMVFSAGAFARGGMTSVKLALAGVAVGTLLHALSSIIAIHFRVAQDLTFWYAGGLAGTQWLSVKIIIPVAIFGFVAAMIISKSVTILSLGEEVSKGLGQKTWLVKLLGIIIVLALTGAAVSIAGSIGFVGLVIPHITRFLVGMDYRWIIPCSAILGGLLLTAADLGARLVNAPYETPAGIITAVIGVPFFLYLARREGRSL